MVTKIRNITKPNAKLAADALVLQHAVAETSILVSSEVAAGAALDIELAEVTFVPPSVLFRILFSLKFAVK